MVCIAVLLGGNEMSQTKFCEYIQTDNENEFMRAVQEQLEECFDIIKRNQTKRNTKSAKILTIEANIQELLDKEVDDDDEELMKFTD